MNTQQEYKDDPIKRYFDPGMVEKAPTGFTEKVMSRVSLEAQMMKAGNRRRKKSYVPAISLTVILILTVAAFALPSSGHEFESVPWMKMLHNIEFPVLKINLDSLLRFKLPGYLPYLVISILFLSILDRALSGMFNREKKG
jgi:hypothetical protein